MSQKLEFVGRASKGAAIASLCREYGVSRQTGHKWIKRFRERGYEGLEEESRRPKSVPLATAEELVMTTLPACDEHPRWGPIKLRVVLARRYGSQTPSERTIARIVHRANKVREWAAPLLSFFSKPRCSVSSASNMRSTRAPFSR